SLARRVRSGYASVVQPVQTSPRPDPQIAGAVQFQREHRVIQQSVLLSKGPEFTILEDIQAPAQCPDVKTARAVFKYRTGLIAEQAFVRCVRSDVAVGELVEPVFGAGPKRSFAIDI